MKRMTGMILMGVGLIAFLSGAFVYGKAEKNEKMLNHEEQLNQIVETAAEDGVITQRESLKIEKRAKELGLDHKKYLESAEQLARDHTGEDETQVIDHIKKSGDDFEKFIVKKFDRKHFNVLEWAGDKYVDGIYADTTLHPDLLMELVLKSGKKKFYVECKWRKEFKNGSVKFARIDQLERYKSFEKEKEIPVFIALGVGGTASNPEFLYTLPLRHISINSITKKVLEKYQIDIGKDFYYHTKTNQLR